MYKLGFCPNGPDCRYRHAKLPGPPPPVEEVLQKIQHLVSYNFGHTNRFSQNKNANFVPQADKSQSVHGPNGANQAIRNSTMESPFSQLQQNQQAQQGQQSTQTQTLATGQHNQANRSSVPLPQGTSRYFIVKSCNRENLELSVQQGVWATQRSNEAKLNEAFDSVENVILIFSVNRTRHFQGCAKMTSRIGGAAKGGNWKHEHGTAHYGRNFSLKWLKLCELSFQKTRHLRNPYNENLPVKISRDCQELEASVGEQLASLLYLEPDSELMAISLAAESKREEEKAKGMDIESGNENPDIVPFEENEEEEEEEESEEEDESFGQAFGPAAMGRGRGRGMPWPPMMPPIGRGVWPPLPGMRGFPPTMMGDGFPYPGLTPDGFPMDMFGMGQRPFGPYGPRFAGDMMFHNRPPGGGFGPMMGQGRGPFLGPPRGGHLMGMGPPFVPQPPSHALQNAYRGRRDHRASEPSDRSGLLDQGKVQEMGSSAAMGPDDKANYHQQQISHRNDESESEDEAPRRSRHGEGKKRRGGGLEGDLVTPI